MSFKITKCRVCGNKEFEEIMSLGDQVLTGVFPSSKAVPITSGPVNLLRCSDPNGCGLVQLRQSYDMDEMYGMNYGYQSSLNPSMVAHLNMKVKTILSLGILDAGDLVIDIGSNDATTLKAYPKGEFQLLGIDPTGIKFSHCYTDEIKLVPDYFSAQSILEVTGRTKAKIITSFSMFYDLEDPISFAKDIESSLHQEGLWIFEQSYLPAMLETNSFDTICHEHLNFYSLKQIHWILKKAKLKLIDIEFNDVNGGSFSVTAAKLSSKRQPNSKVIQEVDLKEKTMNLDSAEPYDSFRDRVRVAKDEFLEFLDKAKERGEIVSALGASTKGNVLLQYYGVTEDLINTIGEVNSDKFGCFTPGTHIPLVNEADLLKSKPDYLVILPWHFREFFLSLPKLKGYNLVFPLPVFEIIKVE
jgi:hypothetical protein